jgi:hypothetical protein
MTRVTGPAGRHQYRPHDRPDLDLLKPSAAIVPAAQERAKTDRDDPGTPRGRRPGILAIGPFSSAVEGSRPITSR